jgi:hypothetical protein
MAAHQFRTWFFAAADTLSEEGVRTMPTLIQTDPPRPAREWQPTMENLPSEDFDSPRLPDEFCFHQAMLLDETFRPPSLFRDAVYSALDLNDPHCCYDLRDATGYVRLDRFALLGLTRFYKKGITRANYLVRLQGEAPLIAVELLSSDTTEGELDQLIRDLINTPPQWTTYDRRRCMPYYVIFSRQAVQMRIFWLNRERYDEVPDHGEWLWLAEAELGLGLWQGRYRGQDRLWLRWFDAQGNCLPTPTEQVEHERQRAEQLQQRAALLAERLRQLGEDPEQL